MDIEPTEEAGAAFFGSPPNGPIVMLNLLRYRDVGCGSARHKSAQALLSFARHEEYLAGVGHRTASLADSRLLPIVEGE